MCWVDGTRDDEVFVADGRDRGRTRQRERGWDRGRAVQREGGIEEGDRLEGEVKVVAITFMMCIIINSPKGGST